MSRTEIRKKKVELVTTVIGMIRQLKMVNPTPELLQAAREVEDELQTSLAKPETAGSGAGAG